MPSNAPLITETEVQRQEKEHWHRIAATLKEFTRSEGWDCYTGQIALIENQFIHNLINAGPAEHDYLRGYINGLRNAVHLPERIITRVQTGGTA